MESRKHEVKTSVRDGLVIWQVTDEAGNVVCAHFRRLKPGPFDVLRGIAGQLRTPTGLAGRDLEQQLAEYERRCNQAADDLNSLARKEAA